jgi:ketosteroid isomerase-like protein
MDNTPHNLLVTSSASADGIVPEQTLPTPHFDEKAVRQARPAVPLEQIKARLLWLVIVLMCSSALLGVVIGLTISQQNSSEQISTSAADVAPEGTSQNEFSEPLSQSVADSENPRLGGSEANAEATRAVLPRENSAAGDEPMSDTQGGDARAKLQGALDEWIAATNARDIQRQMGFYNQKVNAFYLTRNVPREAVRAEKSRVFGRANVIDIRAAAPGIRVSRDGRTATMRFRKKYTIEGGGEDRRGEVVQELRWQRTGDGWKIVSERDLRVIN